MADEVLYKRPNEKVRYTYDFTPKLADTDTALSAISTSNVSAVDEEGNDASSTVVANKSISGLILSADLIAGTDGKDYLVTYKGVGSTSSNPREWVVEMRVRSKVVGNV
jgi:hypothetical protein